MKQAVVAAEGWKSMPWARNELEELRDREHEIEHLRNEKQEDCFAEPAQDSHHGEGHPGEIAESVANKHPRGVPLTTGAKYVIKWESCTVHAQRGVASHQL